MFIVADLVSLKGQPKYNTNRLRAKKKVLLPPPREFSRHILSERKFQVASFKRCLHSVLRGVSL